MIYMCYHDTLLEFVFKTVAQQTTEPIQNYRINDDEKRLFDNAPFTQAFKSLSHLITRLLRFFIHTLRQGLLI